jgi:hypothetical protein
MGGCCRYGAGAGSIMVMVLLKIAPRLWDRSAWIRVVGRISRNLSPANPPPHNTEELQQLRKDACHGESEREENADSAQ